MARCRVRGSVHYTYDTLDRLTELRYNTGTGTAAYRYIYDAEGRLARALDSLENRRTDYTYDLAGRLVEQKQRAGQEDGSAARLYLRKVASIIIGTGSRTHGIQHTIALQVVLSIGQYGEKLDEENGVHEYNKQRDYFT